MQEVAMPQSRGMELRKFGPKKADHPSVGRECPACGKLFLPGDFTTLVALGPAADPEEQKKAREGVAYYAVAVECHWTCATGEVDG
jgi:hypothetical protein